MYSYVKYTDQLSTTDSDYQCKIDDPGCRFTTHVSSPVLHLVSSASTEGILQADQTERKERSDMIRQYFILLVIEIYKILDFYYNF